MTNKGPIQPSIPCKAKEEVRHHSYAHTHSQKYSYLSWSDILGRK